MPMYKKKTDLSTRCKHFATLVSPLMPPLSEKQAYQNEKKWYVMRVFQNEKKAEEMLSAPYGLEHFIPKKNVVRTRHGKAIVCKEPVIRSLIFVHATREQILEFKQHYYNNLQFVIWNRDGNARYIIVPEEDMKNFMLVYRKKEHEATFFRPDEINIEKGVRVKIHGGSLDTLTGIFVKVANKRRKQVVVIIPDTIAISAEVDDGIIEVINKKIPPPK